MSSFAAGLLLDAPPVIVKHDLLWKLELLSRDYERVRALREHLEHGGSPPQVLRALVEQRVLDERVAEHLLHAWASPSPWLGDSSALIVEKLRESFLHVRRGGPYLSGLWIMGFPSVRAFVAPTPEAVYLFVLTPFPPAGWALGKRELDPTFASVLRAARDRIEALLAGN